MSGKTKRGGRAGTPTLTDYLVFTKLANVNLKRRQKEYIVATAADREFMQQCTAQAAALLRTVGNEQRLLVLCLLIDQGEAAVGTLLEQVQLSQSALSQHLARMREEGLVTYRRDAQTLYYRIADPAVEKLVSALKDIFCG